MTCTGNNYGSGFGYNSNYSDFTNLGHVVANGGGSNSGFLNSTNFTNKGEITANSGSDSGCAGKCDGFQNTKGKTLYNNAEGKIYATGGVSHGLLNDDDSSIINDGSINIQNKGSSSTYVGLYNRKGSIINNGSIYATGSTKGATYGMYNSALGTVTNNAGGYVLARGGKYAKAYGWREGGQFDNYGQLKGIGGSEPYTYGFYMSSGVVNNQQGGVVIGQGSDYLYAAGIMIGTNAILNNSAGAVMNADDGLGSNAYGIRNNGNINNDGTLNLNALKAISAINGNGVINQSNSGAAINANLLALMEYTCTEGESSSGTVKYINADGQLVSTDAFAEATGEDGFSVGTLASFLTSNISAGMLNITDTDWSVDAQTKIKEAIYAAGVGTDVNITFAGTGTKGETAKEFSLVKFMDNVVSGTLFPELIIDNKSGSLVDALELFGDGNSPVSEQKYARSFQKSFGVRGFDGVSNLALTRGAFLQVLGDGSELFKNPDETFKADIDNQSLLILGSDNSNITSKQGGTLTGQVSLAGRLQVAAVADKYSLSDLRLSETAQVTNAGHINVEQLAFNTGTATVMNSGVMRVAAVTASQVGSTLKNTGTYAQTDLSAFGDIQNKGTLKTGTLTVGAADKLINGGTILAEKITIDGLLQNRNGTFALGTAAVAKYLEKHLDLAQQLKDLGETLPTSVENLLTAQAETEAASLTTLELTDGERPVETDDETSETAEGTDFASWFAAMQAANAPQGRLATREGRLVFAGLSTYADNQAQMERQLQSSVSGLWADVIASQSEMDGYKANRSGIAVGLQGTNDVGFTFGVAARYSDGKLKGDSLASENWTSVGGSAYAAWANDDAFVSGYVGYDNLKTKGADELTNDVVSAGVKSGLKLDVGPVHVTPFIGGEVVYQKVNGLEAATTYRFPMGVGVSGQYETYGAWQVHPSLEVAFVPQAGDKVIDVTDKVDSRFAGNYAVESRLGIVVEKKNLMLGINYHGSAGDAGLRSHSLQANVKYRF